MTRITAILGLLIPVAVTAAPAKDETAERVSYSDPKAQKTAQSDDWVELASPTPAKNEREFIQVDARYTQLKVEAAKGHPRVKSLRIVFEGGKEKLVPIKHVPARIDVGNDKISHIVVMSDWKSKGSYVVLGATPEASQTARR